MRSLRSSEGFTLTEVLIVVAIISVLSAIAIPVYLSQQTKVESAQVDKDVANLMEMLAASRMQGFSLPSGDLLAGVTATIAGVGTFTPAQTMRAVLVSGEICVEAEVVDPDSGETTGYRHRTESDAVTDGQCSGGSGGSGGSGSGGSGLGGPTGDLDGDGIPNASDPDVDEDGIPNDSDPDDDNDGFSDVVEALDAFADPYDPALIPLTYGSSTLTFTAAGDDSYTVQTPWEGPDGVAPTYSTTALPSGVTFDPATGTLTGPPASAWNFTAAQVSANGTSSCAVDAAGAVWCWGDNAKGQLGTGTAGGTAAAPGEVTGLGSATQVGVGNAFACALLGDATVWCWGDNTYGQLGGGATGTPVATPAAVTGLPGAIDSIAVGYSHACAMTTSGDLYCWGQGTSGQLGNAASANAPTPVQVAGVGGSGTLSGVTHVSAGAMHTCAVVAANVFCWGMGTSGQLGNGASATSNTPVQVLGVGGSGTLSGVTQVSVGFNFSCALSATGDVFCWGLGTKGQLGNGASATSNTPVQVAGVGGSGTLSGVTHVSVGGNHACAAVSGSLACWGEDQRLGSGGTTTAAVNVPTYVSGGERGGSVFTGAQSLSAGYQHSCATAASGVYCWGADAKGQLGDGATSPAYTPVTVGGGGAPAGFPATVTITATTGTATATVDVTLTLG